MKKVIYTFIIIFIIILFGIIVGIYLYNRNNTVKENFNSGKTEISISNNSNNILNKNIIETINSEEKTTPNSLLVYKTYYTKCNHFINEYKDIDISMVNLTKDELQERNRDWKIEDFSSEQVIFSREIEDFCMEHFKLKLINGQLIIFIIDEEGNESEYEITDITEEYLTSEDILKLREGILVFGKENLVSTIEDYE